MQENLLIALPLIVPFSLVIYAVILLTQKNPNARFLSSLGGTLGLLGVIIALESLWIVLQDQTFSSPMLGWQGLGFSIRLDMLSTVMFAMISILGYIILRYSANYMDGDERKHVFFGRLALTIAAVDLLILSGNIFQILFFWIVTSVCLHYLLVFYRHRPQAVAAARKKFFIARLGDLSLTGAVVLLYSTYNTGDLGEIFSAIKIQGITSSAVMVSAGLLAMAAVLKSAQFPSHGWLIEVVETPTPVSALLHAGLLNAGPFLMVRLSYLMVESTGASLMLMFIGGFTALFASVVYLTQPSIKISLGYSSVAHMGFSLLLCGLGLYAAAILHIVGHSFYKAHAFLSSGSVVDELKLERIKLSPREGRIGRILVSVIISMAIFTGCAYWGGLSFSDDFNLLFISAVIIMGISQFITQAIDIKSHLRVIVQVSVMAVVVSCSFLILEHGAGVLLDAEIPTAVTMNVYQQVAAIILLLSFGTVTFIQLIATRVEKRGLAYRWGVHLRNGLYANVLFDRLIGALRHEKFKWANLHVQEEKPSAVGSDDRDTVAQEVDQLLNIQ